MILISAIASVSFLAGMFFMAAVAWPVAGFIGLDVALIYLAFKTNYRWARMYETVRLSSDSLLVERVEFADALTGALPKLRSPECLQSTFEAPLDQQAAKAS